MSDRRGGGKERIGLTPRDIKVFEMAAKGQFILPEDVRHLWPGNNYHHYSRLRKHARTGYLEPVYGHFSSKLAYRITRKGIAALPSAELRAKALNIRRVHYRTTAEHDHLAMQIQRNFEKSPLVRDYLCEAEVKNGFGNRYQKKENKEKGYKVPDGLFRLRTKDGEYRVAVEVERSVKASERYKKLFRELLLQIDFDVVLYFVKSDEMKNLLKRYLKDVLENDLVVKTARRKNGIYFTNTLEFLELGPKAVFEGESTRFSLETLMTS